jgi:hypothetical protein
MLHYSMVVYCRYVYDTAHPAMLTAVLLLLRRAHMTLCTDAHSSCDSILCMRIENHSVACVNSIAIQCAAYTVDALKLMLKGTITAVLLHARRCD